MNSEQSKGNDIESLVNRLIFSINQINEPNVESPDVNDYYHRMMFYKAALDESTQETKRLEVLLIQSEYEKSKYKELLGCKLHGDRKTGVETFDEIAQKYAEILPLYAKALSLIATAKSDIEWLIETNTLKAEIETLKEENKTLDKNLAEMEQYVELHINL